MFYQVESLFENKNISSFSAMEGAKLLYIDLSYGFDILFYAEKW